MSANYYRSMRPRGVIVKPNLWRVGFHIPSVAAINLLSGLVDIHETLLLPDQDALVFVVTNRDKTKTLFKNGSLQGTPINGYQPTSQDLVVEWPKGRGCPRGGN